MTAIYYILGVLIFVIALLASVGLHECGHMIPAKKFGVRVSQFFIGFGKTLWSRQRGETEYGFKAIPLGGYVKLIGMLPPDDQGRARPATTGWFSQLIDESRAAEWEHIRPEDEGRLFYQLPWWKRVIVMAGGPLVNLVIAFVIFAGIYGFYGNPNDSRENTTLSQVSACVVPVDEGGRECASSDPVSPAKQAGLEVGDRLLTINGVKISSWDQATRQIRAAESGQLAITYQRDGVTHTTSVNTLVTARPDPNDPSKTVQAGYLGVSPTFTMVKGGPAYTLAQMGSMAQASVKALAKLPVSVFHVGGAIVGAEKRDPNGPVSIVGGGRIAGETASAKGFPVKEKAIALLSLIAGFNFFIGILNLVPLPPLDGGRIAGALYEALRRAIARVLKKPDPGYFDEAKIMPLVYTIAGALTLMGLVLIIGDLVVPITTGA